MNQTKPVLRLNPTIISRAVAAVVFATAVASPAVQAQAKDSIIALEEVIVTARKREESIQDVPISVTSIGKELREASLRRLEDIQSFTPNVYIRNTTGIPGGAAISIRGVSYQETDKSLDPSIGVVMDGLYLGTSSGSLLQNFDIQRIEVLRGAQGTLFGKNTTGGVLNIIRGDVTMDWGGDLSVTLGDEGREDFKGVVNMPIIKDELGVKLFAASINSDGWIDNTTTGDDALGDDKQLYGFAAKWQPNENFDIKFHYEHADDKTDTGAYANVNQPEDLTCALQGAFWPIGCETSDPGSDKNNVSTNNNNENDSEYDTYILTMNWDLGPFMLTSITGRREMDEEYLIEFDGSPANLLYFDYFNDWNQTSQELRITSNFSEKVDFVAGLYYWDAGYEQRWNVHELNYLLSLIGVPSGSPDPLTPNSINYNGQNQNTESYAAFASADWHVNDQWTLTAGFRYTYEEKDFKGADGTYYERGEPVPDLNMTFFDDDWSETSPKLGASYQYNDDIMFFASWSEGFKSGGFFGRQAEFPEGFVPNYDPEYVTNWELGMKSTWLDGRLIFNPTIFYNDYDDKQEEILVPIDLSNVATVVRNASTVEIFGAEMEVQFQVTEAWNIRASYGYLNAEFDDYVADIDGGDVIEPTDNSYLDLRNTPENTIGLNTTYTVPFGPGEFVAFASYRWRDEVETIAGPDRTVANPNENDPLGHLDSIENLDVTLNYIWNDGRYRVSAYGRNITDERERVVVRIPGLSSWGNWSQGDSYGVEFAMSF